ncbi:MAG: DUF3612 domain-containing protein [Candidatus Marinimicrobia bacterium]|jgi:transcriptional regulator with XRE-family HTH domain|nr:DUF3612 domain-containing protein [Candidatus Neomarinimicrobiota bacterium]MBT3676060.1 DUF3612 domain-containing protein [Candidatus Neomarinimicrobiota bacterium]MBT3762439.1 DUF3612 domain-containing protein [Candidatus Neomarinimicrobiota bacterium]MBT4067474.1 DUF3612 domain-containing protein [Candidatus Neomarinimicrobiota bacterium]MBT4271669.1 DUF3612 domain-containing protein [Candidatus Neomarinimicrobiota bacterium]
MKPKSPTATNAHFLGSKLRILRKQSGMTLEDLAARSVQIDAINAPSVSYISLIERGQRAPAPKVLEILASIFQRESTWLLDDAQQPSTLLQDEGQRSADRLQLEPQVLFSNNLMEISIPELLNQASITGRQFAHILIRSYQEHNRNQFPDLERAADSVSQKRFPLRSRQILEIYKQQGLKVKWFKKESFQTISDEEREVKTFFRSFYDSPNTVFLNEDLKHNEARLKYDLAYHLGHKVLHGGDGLISSQSTGGELGGSPPPSKDRLTTMNQQDILTAWRDFECSFFAGAFLCPRQPFRQYLSRKAYDIFSGKQIELTPAVVMRRMTVVSPYRHWHYFDIYPPNKLRAVYRGNGIPLPSGTMTDSPDFCRQWALFQMADDLESKKTLTQISLMREEDRDPRLYACIATQTKDGAGNPHIISVGIDLFPLLETYGTRPNDIIEAMEVAPRNKKNEILMPQKIKEVISSAARIINISWVEKGLNFPVSIICPRQSQCPRRTKCTAMPSTPRRISWVEEIKDIILKESD